VTTADVLQGIAETRRTLTAELVADFEQDIKDYARVCGARGGGGGGGACLSLRPRRSRRAE
jgi:hypothetical protein